MIRWVAQKALRVKENDLKDLGSKTEGYLSSRQIGKSFYKYLPIPTFEFAIFLSWLVLYVVCGILQPAICVSVKNSAKMMP